MVLRTDNIEIENSEPEVSESEEAVEMGYPVRSFEISGLRRSPNLTKVPANASTG